MINDYKGYRWLKIVMRDEKKPNRLIMLSPAKEYLDCDIFMVVLGSLRRKRIYGNPDFQDKWKHCYKG